ncbi:Putative peptidoglycan binding domain protein [Roseovarius albus]|uniref:Putative peptidoglycan binding domain protein n=1 Tax=Roseovarius albus TaxID=1247867 RepID=A0A1X6YKM2_9RHOB|nr:serine protease [Roseovarius albus]SLN23634.1 Putative peptidoglycan binding domain protein [Roseovarius albus]
MLRIFYSLVMALFFAVPTAWAQQSWVQIEAQPSLSEAQERIRDYARQLQDINGFALGSGWYGIALGPYSEDDASQVLRNLRAQGLIPRDSYITRNSDYQRQFWPVGANALSQQVIEVAPQSDIVTQLPDNTATIILPAPQEADESPAQARASERDLTREQRAEIQTALKWAGFYGGTVDAAFGRGTRGSMARWQEASGFDDTGVLTTGQRAELLRQYYAVLEGLDIQTVRNEETGIEIKLPLGVVELSKYDPPFAHYGPSGNIDASILLISQEGGTSTLAGLYDIMQTLEIVPEDGPRQLTKDSFTLIGESAFAISHTQAWLKDGEIKGFTLIWPAGDEERRTRLLGIIQDSFTRIDGVLDPAAGYDEVQDIDLVSGLKIRKPVFSRSGFFVDGSGTIVTSAEFATGCNRLTINNDYTAEIVSHDTDLGLATLRPSENLAPRAYATFSQGAPRLHSDIAVAGYSYGGILGAPTLTFGQLADVRGLNGEPHLKRLELAALEGDAGGPVLDAGGSVVGMLLPQPSTGKRLPKNVSLATDAQTLQKFLSTAGINADVANETTQLPAEQLTDKASHITVLVSCWGE